MLWPRHTAHIVRFFFLMIRRPPRSTLDRSSAASDVYKRQFQTYHTEFIAPAQDATLFIRAWKKWPTTGRELNAVSYTHLRAHETVLDLVCRLLLEKTNYTTPIVVTRQQNTNTQTRILIYIESTTINRINVTQNTTTL